MSNRDTMNEEGGCCITMIRRSKRATRRIIHVALLLAIHGVMSNLPMVFRPSRSWRNH